MTAFLHQRSRTDPERIAGSTMDCAQALLEGDPPADEDPRVLVDVLDDLARRGDPVAGPTLLLTALNRLRPGSAAIETLLRERAVRPRTWRGTRWVLMLVLIFLGLCVAMDRYGLPGVVLVGAFPGLIAAGWKSWPRLYPELSDADNAALRRIRRGSVGSRAITVVCALLGAAGGLIVTLIGSVLILAAIAPDAEVGDYPVFDWASVVLVIAGVVCGPQLLLSTRLRTLTRIARRQRAAGQHRKATDLARCACWGATGPRGWVAEGYAAHHLRSSDPSVLRGLDLGGQLHAEVRECPDLGRRWLLVPEGDGAQAVLLAGTSPVSEPASAEPGAGGYL